MWKLIVAFFFLSVSCFANFDQFPHQPLIDQWLADLEFEETDENTVFVNADQLEGMFAELTRAKCPRSKRTRILFVDNLNPKAGNGSYKNPFNTLLAAQNASKKGDVIFVFPGDNTTKGMDQGFVMKDCQRLLGAGVHHKIDFPEKKLIVHGPSTTLPRITNTNGSVIILANSCEVSGINIVNITNGDGILGGDSALIPQTPGIKNTLISKNVINTLRRDHNVPLNGAINLPNCRGKLVIQNNFIYNIVVEDNHLLGKGIRVFNFGVPISSHVTIKKNIVSNVDSSGIYLSHNSPKGKVKAIVRENLVFNVGNPADGIAVGTESTEAGGKVCLLVKKNFSQNINIGSNIHVQSSGTARVRAIVENNVCALSGNLGAPNPGILASSLNESMLCLRLVKNFTEFGYTLTQLDTSHFKLEPLHKNLGLPFTINGAIDRVHSGKCDCEHSKEELEEDPILCDCDD